MISNTLLFQYQQNIEAYEKSLSTFIPNLRVRMLRFAIRCFLRRTQAFGYIHHQVPG